MKMAMDMGLLQLTRTAQDQIAVVNFHDDIFKFDARKVCFEYEAIAIVVEIDSGSPTSNFATNTPWAVNHFIEKAFHFAREMNRE
jgi:hypothetical protein